MHPLEQLRDEALREIAGAPDEKALEAARVKYLGKSGSISAWGEQMKSLGKEERPIVGQLLNEARNGVTAALEERAAKFRAQSESEALANIDISLPGTPHEIGSLHPLTQMLDRAIGIFRRMGFALADGPDIETEWHCFDALNTPPDHPARNEQDTFYLPDGRLLRTHTSTVQIRTMESAPPPIRVIAPGAAYRRDEVDATHSAQFHQIEGLYVDENVSVADLKGTLEFFFHELLGPDTAVRFRPHYFPFTEPSFEIDVKSTRAQERRTMDRNRRLRYGAPGGLRGSKPGARRRYLRSGEMDRLRFRPRDGPARHDLVRHPRHPVFRAKRSAVFEAIRMRAETRR